MNNALKALLENAKKEGAIKSSETTKQNIYKEEYFAGVTDEREEKKIRRTLRNVAINYLSLLAGSKDKKEFTANYAKFEKFFADTYICKNVDFSIFESLRKDSSKKILSAAVANFNKWNK